jgi:hypothetical protein
MKILCNCILTLLLAGMSAAAVPADLKVRVFERGGNAPLPGVAVCLGTPARLNQFGASLTDAGGYAGFSDIPQGPLLVTASRPGFKAEQENLVTSNTDRTLVISLSAGGGGSQCPIDAAAGGRESGGLGVSRFLINQGAAQTGQRKVTLNSRVTGGATQYRAGERSDLRDAPWQDYAGQVSFELSQGAGNKVVYFQVRRHATINGADLEVLSPVVRDSIRLTP